jgi:hypothetical protein
MFSYNLLDISLNFPFIEEGKSYGKLFFDPYSLSSEASTISYSSFNSII